MMWLISVVVRDRRPHIEGVVEQDGNYMMLLNQETY